MDENKEKIGENVSSGAEKVETVEKTVKKTEKAPRTSKKAEEKAKAAERVKKAKAKTEKKEKKALGKAEKRDRRRALKLEAKERRAQRKAEAKERAAARKAAAAERRDMLKNETAVERLARKEREKKERVAAKDRERERRHALALKRKEIRLKKREQRLEARAKRRENSARREHAPGFGGWLAAVIALGVTTLAMGTLVTAGAINMSDLNGGIAANYMSEVYEIDEATDIIQNDFSKLRVSSSAAEQAGLLTDVLVRSEVAQTNLERLPIDSLLSSNIAGFINRTSAFAEEALQKLYAGETLSESDVATISYLYNLNSSIRSEIDSLSVGMSVKDIMSFMNGDGEGKVYQSFNKIGESTLSSPDGVNEGPFVSSAAGGKALQKYGEITSGDGEKIVLRLLKNYGVTECECVGEATAGGFSAYSYNAKDENGDEYYVQLTKRGGKLVMLDSHKDCSDNAFDAAACEEIAEEFLKTCGFADMEAVWVSESGTTCNMTFAYEQDGVICYADTVKVKVCETRGIVTGVEAFAYWNNHVVRDIPSPSLTKKEALNAVGEDFDVSLVRLALLPVKGREKLCYEVSGEYGGDEYCVYIDSSSGKEIKVFSVENSDRGRILR